MKHCFVITKSIYSPTFGIRDQRGPGFYLGGLVHTISAPGYNVATFCEDENNEFCIPGVQKTPIYRIVP